MPSRRAPAAPPPIPPRPPLLLTRRLVSFLSSSLTPCLSTAFLATPSGKLLAHASIDPASTTPTLRTRATVAGLLWDIHASASVPAAEAIAEGARRLQQALCHENESSATWPPKKRIRNASGGSGQSSSAKKPTTITVQLERSVLVIRRLACGILFVASGLVDSTVTQAVAKAETHHDQHVPDQSASPGVATGQDGGEHHRDHLDEHCHSDTLYEREATPQTPKILEPETQWRESATRPIAPGLSHPTVTRPRTEPSSTPTALGSPGVFHSPGCGADGEGGRTRGGGGIHLAVGSPSDSILSTGASSTVSIGAQGAVALRKQAEEVAQMLDVKLAGLRVPAERIGPEFA